MSDRYLPHTGNPDLIGRGSEHPHHGGVVLKA